VYATFAVGQLGNLSQADRAAWADVINSFQNKSTGWFNPYPWEHQNQGNWPWHPTGAAMETLDLLNCSSCVPRYPMTANLAILESNESTWKSFMDKYVVNTSSPWGSSQQAQCVAAIPRSANLSNVQRFAGFYDFYFAYLRNHSSPANGYWPGHTSDPVDMLGGAFHLYHMFSCANQAWPHPEKVVDATLASQNQTDGMWRTRHHTGHPGVSNCIDLDGVYSTARSALLASDTDGTPYRWDDVKAACSRYLKTAQAQLTDPHYVLHGQWAHDSHLMHGALNAVAECALHFPELVKTVRPWQRAGGALNDRACFYG